jgi:hypothetical protein
MSNFPHETRSELVCRIAREAWNAKAVSLTDFSRAVVAYYFANTPESSVNTNLRQPSTTSAARLEEDEKHNRQIVERLMKGVVKTFPADLEEAWVMALPDTYREQALRDLAARYGLLPARAVQVADFQASAATLMKAIAQVMETFAPIAQDGVINHLDRPHLKPFLASIADAQGVLASLAHQAAQALADETNPSVVHIAARKSTP